jgi:hypothetical protein
MINFAGQDITKNDYVVQIARTNQGMVRRAGVVLGFEEVEGTLRLRTGWYDPEEQDTYATESVVAIDNLVKVDPNSLPSTTVRPLEFVQQRGRAKL